MSHVDETDILEAEHPLLHSYAAICSNVLTTVQDRVVEQGGGPFVVFLVAEVTDDMRIVPAFNLTNTSKQH